MHESHRGKSLGCSTRQGCLRLFPEAIPNVQVYIVPSELSVVFRERRQGMVKYRLKLESVLTPDIFIRVHRINWNQRPVPFAHAVRQVVRLDHIPEGLLRYRGGNYLIEDPSFMGNTVSLMAFLHTTNTGE